MKVRRLSCLFRIVPERQDFEPTKNRSLFASCVSPGWKLYRLGRFGLALHACPECLSSLLYLLRLEVFFVGGQAPAMAKRIAEPAGWSWTSAIRGWQFALPNRSKLGKSCASAARSSQPDSRLKLHGKVVWSDARAHTGIHFIGESSQRWREWLTSKTGAAYRVASGSGPG